jgi:hypothetical protein
MIGAPWVSKGLLSILVAVVSLVCLQGAAMAQTQLTGTIRGQVLDEGPAATPIEGAIVTVTNEETGLVRSVISRTNGEYSIELLPSVFTR